MDAHPMEGLSAREREIMDIVLRFRVVSAAEVRAAMTDPPTDAAVRWTLRTLIEKGHLRREREGRRHLYQATRPRDEVRDGVLGHVVRTLFNGSVVDAVAALVERGDGELEPAERRRIQELLHRLEESE